MDITAPRSIPATAGPRVTLRALLPREHGSWSLTLEPVALGLISAPSAAGAALAVATLAVFFLRRPWKLVQSRDGRAGPLVLGVAAGLALLALAGLAGAAVLGGVGNLRTLLLALPAAAMFVYFDTRNEMRAEVAELAGAAAFAVVPAAFGSLAGWPPVPALALAVVALGRSVPAVMLVRAYLRRRRGVGGSNVPSLLVAVAALVLVTYFALAGRAPVAAVVFGVVWVARSAWLLSRLAPRWNASRLGLFEAVLGAVAVVVVGLAWPG